MTLSTVGQIRAMVEAGGPVTCAHCKQPIEADDAMEVALELRVRRIAEWMTRPEIRSVILTPLCEECVNRLVPTIGSQVTL